MGGWVDGGLVGSHRQHFGAQPVFLKLCISRAGGWVEGLDGNRQHLVPSTCKHRTWESTHASLPFHHLQPLYQFALGGKSVSAFHTNGQPEEPPPLAAICARCSWNSKVHTRPVGATARARECVRLPLPVPLSSTTAPGRSSSMQTTMDMSAGGGQVEPRQLSNWLDWLCGATMFEAPAWAPPCRCLPRAVGNQPLALTARSSQASPTQGADQHHVSQWLLHARKRRST